MPTDPLPILALHNGGSGNGISRYLGLNGCIRRMTLGAAWAADHEGDEADSDAGGAASIGTYFHALMESFYNDKEAAVPFETLNTNPALTEALRIYSYYRRRYFAGEFGRIVGCELDCPGEDPEVAGRIKDFYEGEELTARFDMVVELDADACDYQLTRNKMALEPGIYVVDHKTKKYDEEGLAEKGRRRAQFYHYQMMWNLAHPDTPCLGLIANYVFRYQPAKKTGEIDMDKQFRRFFVPPPDAREQASVKSVIRDGARNLRERGDMWANTLHCDDWFRKCPFLSTCTRANP